MVSGTDETPTLALMRAWRVEHYRKRSGFLGGLWRGRMSRRLPMDPC